MATTTLFLTGKAYWVKARQPDPKYNNYTMDLYPDKDSIKALKATGSKLEAVIDDIGTKYRLRRDHEKVIKGDLRVFGPPLVVKATGEIDEAGVPIVEPFTGLVGNGSTVTAKVSFYNTNGYIGHRWEGIRVDQLVEYNPEAREPTPEYPF